MQRSFDGSGKHLLRTSGEVMLFYVRSLPSEGCADIHEPRRLAQVRTGSTHTRNREAKGGARRTIQGTRYHLARHFRMVGCLLSDEFGRDTEGITFERTAIRDEAAL